MIWGHPYFKKPLTILRKVTQPEYAMATIMGMWWGSKISATIDWDFGDNKNEDIYDGPNSLPGPRQVFKYRQNSVQYNDEGLASPKFMAFPMPPKMLGRHCWWTGRISRHQIRVQQRRQHRLQHQPWSHQHQQQTQQKWQRKIVMQMLPGTSTTTIFYTTQLIDVVNKNEIIKVEYLA